MKFATTVNLTKLGTDPKKTIYAILHEYKMHNCEVLIREDISMDQFIDVIEVGVLFLFADRLKGNRKYIKCLYVYNKIDMCTIEQVDRLARYEHSLVISLRLDLGLGMNPFGNT